MKHEVWNIPRAAEAPPELTRAGYPPLLAAVLGARGIGTAAEAAALLEPGPASLEDPFHLADMDRAVERIGLAVRRGETVAVYGDYDVDGITAGCLLTEYLRDAGLKTELYIPDRLEEGYGLHAEAVEQLHGRGVSLVITVDCGVTAVEEAARAAGLGVDLIITDHHVCPARLPNAAAVVNPKRPDSGYAFRELAGVGVAFKLVCALSGDSDGTMRRYADLVALGTIADVMPLTGENRYIVKNGLEKLRSGPRPGLAALMAEAGVAPGRLNATTVGFTLAPRLNAAGRLGQVRCAVELLLERDPGRCAALAAELCGMNSERRRLEADIWRQARKMLGGETPDGPIVLAGEGWHHGVLGIAASRLVEAYHVPAVMISLEEGRGKGSCRSFGGFNLFDALSACGELLVAFGGHAQAAGLTITEENIAPFRAALRDYYAQHPPVQDDALCPELLIDDAGLLSMECVESLETLEPFGAENPRPLLCMTGARVRSVASIGGGRHTSLRLEKFGRTFECVWFSQRADELELSADAWADVAFFPQISEFRGRRSVQLLVQELRCADMAELCRAVLVGSYSGSLSITRGELAAVWRALDADGPVRAALGRLEGLVPGLDALKTALGLRVLSELDLAELELELGSPGLRVTLLAYEGKAELTRSEAWRRYHV